MKIVVQPNDPPESSVQGHLLLDKDGYNGNREPDPRGRSGDSSDDDYKEDPHDLWALRQRQLSNSDPKFEPKPWSPDESSQKPGNTSWLPAQPVEKLLQCSTCGTWAPGSWCNHIKMLRYRTPTKTRYKQQVSHKLPLSRSNTQRPKQTPQWQ